MQRMPAVFIGHGSPMNTLEKNGFTEGWRDLGEAASATTSPTRHIGALVHRRHCRDRNGTPADDSRFLRVSTRTVRL